MPTLSELLADGRVHVMDGAMGTELYNRGFFVNVCYDELSLTEPDLVREVHEAYVAAGAEILETNTFGANPVKLSSFGLEERTEEVNRAAVTIARAAARNRASVVGAIGPLGIRIEPWGPTAREEARAFFARQVQGLIEGGVDGFLLETFSDLDELHEALHAIRDTSDLPVIAQVTIGADENTSYGTSVATIAAQLTDWGAEVIGLNCSVGPAVMLDAIEQMAEVTDTPLSAQPNAGLPRAVGDRRMYLASPEYMAQYAKRMIQAGARFVGGCCGTTPEHIKKITSHVASLQPRLATATPPTAEHPTTLPPPTPLAERSSWGRKIAEGTFVTSVEVLPPRGWDPSPLLAACRTLAESGVDALNVVDSPRAQSRMGALPAALIIQNELGLETVLHYTCRDRNMLGMLSDLLGAAAGGLRNLLLVTGDPPTMGPYPDSTGVFDIDSIGLTNVVHRLNHGLDPGGNTFGAPTQFVVGIALNHSASDPDKELGRFAWKVDAGAEFAVTQPVFEPELLEAFLDGVEGARIPIIAGIWPLTSLRSAEFLENEVPGIHVPQPIIERMRRAQERGADAARAEGVVIAREIFQAVRGVVQGVHISAPFGRVEPVQAVLGEISGRASQ